MASGTLYIISTPIGNLADITLRALDVLKNVDLIASEDTRETAKLLQKYQIEKRQVSYRDQNHTRIAGELIDMLKSGLSIGLISDSGTPLISDPGYKLVQEAILAGISVQSLPGASAVISALVVSGLPTDNFTFLGFLPKSDGQITKQLKTFGELSTTLIIYESPNRVKKLLGQILSVLEDRELAVVNDLTKLYEHVDRGRVSDILKIYETKNLKGEFVVLVRKTN
jgi:16S rRNA (cytidine1402-2'-O)-methyltransferase